MTPNILKTEGWKSMGQRSTDGRGPCIPRRQNTTYTGLGGQHQILEHECGWVKTRPFPQLRFSQRAPVQLDLLLTSGKAFVTCQSITVDSSPVPEHHRGLATRKSLKSYSVSKWGSLETSSILLFNKYFQNCSYIYMSYLKLLNHLFYFFYTQKTPLNQNYKIAVRIFFKVQ